MVEAQVREKPILFSGSMVRAILDGKKTQTRRVIKRQPLRVCFPGLSTKHNPLWPMFFDESKPFESVHCPYGSIGDRLWVRETWQYYGGDEYMYQKCRSAVAYRSTWDEDRPAWKEQASEPAALDYWPDNWRPSIFMPRWASRISLEILKVRVERVQDISKADCIAEGMTGLEDVHAGWHQSYAQLWDSINAKRGYSWESNPWVWVIEFKPVTGRANP